MRKLRVIMQLGLGPGFLSSLRHCLPVSWALVEGVFPAGGCMEMRLAGIVTPLGLRPQDMRASRRGDHEAEEEGIAVLESRLAKTHPFSFSLPGEKNPGQGF